MRQRPFRPSPLGSLSCGERAGRVPCTCSESGDARPKLCQPQNTHPGYGFIVQKGQIVPPDESRAQRSYISRRSCCRNIVWSVARLEPV